MSEEILNVGSVESVEVAPEVVAPAPEVVEVDETVVEEVAPQQAPTE